MAKKLKLDLSVFKSSGVYTLEFDASENIIVNPQTIRLVVGFSNVGPFNTPVYIPDPRTALAVFGDIDRTLEKKGSFFHRSILTCLQSGPVFALNLLKLNNTVDENGNPDYSSGADVARYRSFSLDTEEFNGENSKSEYSSNIGKQDKLVSSYFNKEKFWFPDPNYLLATADSSGSQPDTKKLFHIVNLNQNSVSVIIKKSIDSRIPLTGFDITAAEYFGASNVPRFMHPYDYISDYFIDVIVVSGNWTDYAALSNDPFFSSYFTPKGFIKSKIDDFLALNQINVVLSITGTIIPDFVDQNGINRYIKTLINNETGQTGILCAINEEALDDLGSNSSLLDLVGHHLIDEITPDSDITSVPKKVDFLSYNQVLVSDFVYSKNIDGSTTGTEISDAGSPGSSLIETGTLLGDDIFTSPGNKGVLDSDMKVYSASARDGGLPYIQTAFTGVDYADKINVLSDFLTIKVDSPEKRFIVGKVKNTLPAAGYLGFYVDEIVKLKIEEFKRVTDGTLPVGNQVQIRIRFSHPLVGTTSSNTYVEPWVNTNKNSSANAYQFGSPDYFDFDDVFGSPDIPGEGVGANDSYIAYGNSPAYIDWSSGNITDGDTVWKDTTGGDVQYLKLENNIDRDGFSYLVIRAYQDSDFTSAESVVGFGLSYKSSVSSPINQSSTYEFSIVSLAGNLNEYVDIISQVSQNVVEISVSESNDKSVKVGDLLVSTDLQLFDNPSTENVQSRLTRIIEVRKVAVSGSPGQYTIHVKTDRPIKLYPGVPTKVNKFKTIHKFVNSYDLTYLPGFKIKASHRPDGTETRFNEILDVMFNTNIAKTLSDRNIITFRYIVDTFDGGLQTNSKNQLSRLAKSRQKCLAICNAPSIKKFIDSTDPRFTELPTATDPQPLFNPRYIAEGGNLSLNPQFRFTLPDEDLGAKFCGFFSPFLTIRENGKNLNIPPAAHVSNNFIRKFITGEPYSIVAGQKRGILSGSNLIGLEYDFSNEDRDYLEPFGLNPIIRRRGIGLVIYGNQTGYQRTNSAFNNLHVRDLLITIEEAIEDILGNYVFDFNEDSIRLEIKTLVDNYLSGVKSVGGIYNYLTIMDSSNNTPAIIDQNLGIIDVIVEPARGIHKFINRLTVTRTGGINSGGFIQFS